ncbi:MAG: ABC transporter permease [Kiritimatiellae bacterium]|nr:ABC transporter permease [Kiritimatiellia bacterium]
MMFRLMLRGLKRGKARFACAVAGIAVAVGTMVFTTSLVETNNAQAPAAAKAACVPWSAWKTGGGPGADLVLETVRTTVDFRPGGRVLQGPPMVAVVANAPAGNPYGNVELAEGRWVDPSSSEPEVVCVRNSMRRFGKECPELGAPLKFVGDCGTMTAKVVGYLDGGRLPREFPYVFANAPAMESLKGEKTVSVAFWRTVPEGVEGLLTPETPAVVGAFKSDEQRRMDYATPLLIAAAILTALSLLVNSLLLSVESNRRPLAVMRTVGLTRGGVVGYVALEALFASAVGWFLGVFAALASLAAYVAADHAAFPSGMAVDFSRIFATLIALPFISLTAVAFALRPALKVRPADALAARPRRWRHGMAVTFACGFAAFVAVEVWGASLMRAFVPSPEWPDAIVSLLPGGASSFDVEKLRDVEGVKRISELVPRQLPVLPLQEMEGPAGGRGGAHARGGRGGGAMYRNALFLAAEWLPEFNFIEGDFGSASKALSGGNAVVITEMMSRDRNLHKGDALKVASFSRRGSAAEELSFPIAGVVDLNWHMVTSRGLVRGLGGSPVMTDGPVFCSFDTMGCIDPRTYVTEPSMSAPMTHLWVEYEPLFLEKHGVFGAGRMIEAEIAKRLGNPGNCTVRLHARDEIADGTLAHGNDVIGQAARVPFVFLAILAIGFVAMLVAEADARRCEFATLHAVGATRLQLAGKLAGSALKTALAGILAGLPLGALAGWLFTFATGNWPGLPHWFVLPARIVAEGAIGAVVFALVFAVPTALSLMARATDRRNGPV